mmetsp:Transcript_37341/g.87904  ORF Transcript_37341/g.87904 Transcript_37341/m.87904 type:complete len:378 (+) Transcript_37341:475-1608(+)
MLVRRAVVRRRALAVGSGGGGGGGATGAELVYALAGIHAGENLPQRRRGKALGEREPPVPCRHVLPLDLAALAARLRAAAQHEARVGLALPRVEPRGARGLVAVLAAPAALRVDRLPVGAHHRRGHTAAAELDGLVVVLAHGVVDGEHGLGAQPLLLRRRGRVAEGLPRAAGRVEVAVGVLSESEGSHRAVQAVVDDVRLLQPARTDLVRVDHHPLGEDVPELGLGCGEDVTVHLADPRRRALAHVGVTRQDVVVGASEAGASLSVLALDPPVLLRVEAHLLTVVEPPVGDLADVLDVEEVVPASRGDLEPFGRRRGVHVDIGARVLCRLCREEHVLQPVAQAHVEVADVLRDDDAPLHAELDRVHRPPYQHVGVNV